MPTVFENYIAEIIVEGKNFDFHLWDTAGQEDYAHIRPVSYADAHVFFICFSIVSRVSRQP